MHEAQCRRACTMSARHEACTLATGPRLHRTSYMPVAGSIQSIAVWQVRAARHDEQCARGPPHPRAQLDRADDLHLHACLPCVTSVSNWLLRGAQQQVAHLAARHVALARVQRACKHPGTCAGVAIHANMGAGRHALHLARCTPHALDTRQVRRSQTLVCLQR